KDIGRPNFHPYIQVHEFEALILTRPSVLKDYYPEHSLGITELCLECESFATPVLRLQECNLVGTRGQNSHSIGAKRWNRSFLNWIPSPV
ncbi:MAG: hypothetical protein JWM68_5719, partial [Verrucomicrobiales bacterium]|nr:hypothetical protein [Verrucomicrobiales bacterium]